MDPTQALRNLVAALAANDMDEAYEIADDLRDWRARGGFDPKTNGEPEMRQAWAFAFGSFPIAWADKALCEIGATDVRWEQTGGGVGTLYAAFGTNAVVVIGPGNYYMNEIEAEGGITLHPYFDLNKADASDLADTAVDEASFCFGEDAPVSMSGGDPFTAIRGTVDHMMTVRTF